MNHHPGEPVKGILNNADVSTATAIPIFREGSNTAYTLQPDEYLVVYSLEVIYATGGDIHVFVGADGTPGTGETVARGTVGANGGLIDNELCHAGQAGQGLWVDADAAGAVDVKVKAAIRRVTDGERPDWRASGVPR